MTTPSESGGPGLPFTGDAPRPGYDAPNDGACAVSIEPAVSQLTVERMTSPIAVATATPLFGWNVDPGCRQVAYELRLNSDDTLIASTGRIESDRTVDVLMRGAVLESDTAYRWTVQCWFHSGATFEASSTFATSLLSVDDWSARWVVPAQSRTVREVYTIADIVADRADPVGPPSGRLHPPLQLREEFEIGALTPVRARLFATARGIYAAEVNGHPIGDEVLAPGYDSYRSRLSFQCYDVTDAVTAGVNVVGMTLADGWYAGRMGITGSSAQYGDELAAIWQLSLVYEDGSRRVFGSGSGAALCHRGGCDYADLFIGERFDARKTTPGWSSPGYAAAGWAHARTEDADFSVLVPFSGEPVRAIERRPAVVTRLDPSTYLVDLTQVIAGRLHVTIRAARGTELEFEHSEVLLPDGSFFDNIVGPNKEQRDVYIARGDGAEQYEPTFTFHGFRYVRITGSEPFELAGADGVVLGSDLRMTSTLRTSDARLDQLHRNIVWSQRANFLSIPTDCPQRERAGWTGDLQVYAPAAATTMDIRQFTERWLANCRAEQFPDGRIPTVVPIIPSMHDGGESDVTAAAGWSDAIALVPWALYQRYEDKRALADNYDAMIRWVEFQQARAEAEIPERVQRSDPDPATRANHRSMWNTGWQFGDWLAPSIIREGADPVEMAKPHIRSEIVAAMFHAHTTETVAKIASVLGRADDARRLRERARTIRTAFADTYVSPEGLLAVELQGTYVLALAFNLIPSHMRASSHQRLIQLIAAADEHLDTGFLSTPHLLDVLWDAGEHDLARRLFWQSTPPSWFYAVDQGATTVWESWEAIRPDGTPTRASFNHYAFGCVDDWIVRRIGGIEAISPGYARSRIAPDVDGPVSSAHCEIDTVHGILAVDWRREGSIVRLTVDVPHGCLATVEIGSVVETCRPGTRTVVADAAPPVMTHIAQPLAIVDTD